MAKLIMQIILLGQLIFYLVYATKPNLVSLFQELEIIRWGHFYPSISQGNIRAVPFNEVGSTVELIEIRDWPLDGAVFTYHFDGSQLESLEDSLVINEHLDRLLAARRKKFTEILVLEDWATVAFMEEIRKRGYYPAETWIIMATEDLNIFSNDQVSEVPEGLETRLIDEPKDFIQFVHQIDPFFQHFYHQFSIDALKSPQMQSWGIFEKASGNCICTVQIFLHGKDTAIIGCVSTAEAWRRRGLASNLMARALGHSVKNDCIRVALLQATSMAVSMYEKMGFVTVGKTLCCKNSNCD